MKDKLIKALYSILCLKLCSCQINEKRENASADIEASKKVAFNFYKLVELGDYSKAALHFDSSIGYDKGFEILQKVNKYVGSLDSVRFLNATSVVEIKGKNKKMESALYFTGYYKSGTVSEEIVFDLIKDSLKITGYHPKVSIP